MLSPQPIPEQKPTHPLPKPTSLLSHSKTITQDTKTQQAMDKILTATKMLDTCKTITHALLPPSHPPSAMMATVPPTCIMPMMIATNKTKTMMKSINIMEIFTIITTRNKHRNHLITSQHMNQQITLTTPPDQDYQYNKDDEFFPMEY